MENLVNPFSDTNSFYIEFEELFEAREYDGAVIWEFREIYIQYNEICELVGIFLRQEFSFENENFFNPGIQQFLQGSHKYLDKLIRYMKEINFFVKNFNLTTANFFNYRRVKGNPRTLEDASNLWKFIHEKTKLKDNFALAVSKLITKLEKALFAHKLDKLLEDRQEEACLPYNRITLHEYILQRTRLITSETPFCKGTESFLDKCCEYISVVGRNIDEETDKIVTLIALYARDMLNGFKNELLLNLVEKFESHASRDTNRVLRRKKVPYTPSLELGNWSLHRLNKNLHQRFNLESDNKQIKFKLDNHQKVSMNISLISPLSIRSIFNKNRLHIVREARFYAFVYPIESRLAEEYGTLQNLEQYDGLRLLLLNGGFLYLDENQSIVRLTSLQKTERGDLSFQGPFSVTNHLYPKNLEFQAVQSNEFTGKDVVEYAWVPPRALALQDNGGLLYKFVSRRRTVYFFYRFFFWKTESIQSSPGHNRDFFFTNSLKEFGRKLNYEDA